MHEAFSDLTWLDLLRLVGAFVIANLIVRGAKAGLNWFLVGPMESCTRCHFKVRSNDKQVTDLLMLNHYQSTHPELSTAARRKYGKD